MIDKIIFSPRYFKDIEKIEHIRNPLESPGEFQSIIKVYYKKKWFGLISRTEEIKLSSKEAAEKLLDELIIIMNGKDSINDLIHNKVK
jgi:hypothetical protein